jgi:hypothetical protein
MQGCIMHSYIHSPGFITENQAIQLIYDCIYPNDLKSDAFKRIRQRIRKAQQDGELAQFSSLKVNPYIFFSWALKSKGWDKLSSIKGLPANVFVKVSGVEANVALGEAYAITDPEANSTELQIKNQDLQKALELKEAELKQVQIKLEAINNKDKIRRERLSNAGKKGGRGKSL